ncbi:MAG: DUF485 domain-containing protein [Proteobacteria bacterium]|nr:DUF485 domain-containing protein [Pseudomonadota bacterium]
MDKKEKLEVIKRKVRQRFLFSAFTIALYFSYVLNYTSAGSFLSKQIGDTHITGSLALYAALIVVFIILELIFLQINRDKKTDSGRG